MTDQSGQMRRQLDRRTFLAATGQAAVGLAGLSASGVAGTAADGGGKVKIRIGQIGTGHAHASGKMASLRRSGDFEVVGLAEPDEKRRAAAGRSKVYRDVPVMSVEQLLNVEGLRAVAVETEVRDLLAAAEKCIEAGMHIHLDKPAGESLAQFKRIMEKARRKKLVVQMGYMFRYNPAFRLCYRAVADGWMGEVFSVHAVISKVIPGSRRPALAAYRGGAMFELGCHVIDSVVKVLGKPAKVTPFNRHSGRYDDDLPDNMLAVFEYPRATATVRSAFLEVEGQRRRQFVVCGDRGTIDIRPLEPPRVRLALARGRGEFKKGYQDVAMPKYVRYDDDVVDLARVLRGQKEFEFSVGHDLAVQEAILAASGRRGARTLRFAAGWG